jgi:hypothetical protein
MSGSRFDVLARKLAGKTTRRTALAGAGAGLAALSLGTAVAQEATPAATPAGEDSFELLFIQNAGATTLTPGSGGVHTLTLSGIATQTLYFTNRPARVSGALPTTSFVAAFTAMFSDAPPNAAIIGHATAGADEEEVVVAALTNPVLAGDTLTYDIEVIPAPEASAGAFESEPLTALDGPREYDSPTARRSAPRSNRTPICLTHRDWGRPNIGIASSPVPCHSRSDAVPRHLLPKPRCGTRSRTGVGMHGGGVR